MNSFTGPLFVVGMPRSGTKLLRNLLNNHSRISMPEHESQFIPAFLKKFGSETNSKEWLTQIKTQKFYLNYPALQHKFNEAILESRSAIDAVASILKIAAPDTVGATTIWGDKSPQYLVHMPILKKSWPNAKFIHVIRDPRDLVLSNQKAWGRNIYRTAYRWNEKVAKALKDGSDLGEDHIFILYENLLESPQETVHSLLQFLGLQMESGMLDVKSRTEQYGDAKGETKVVSSNKGKFSDQLSKSELTKVEELTYTSAQKIGLEYNHGKTQVNLSANALKLYKLIDGLNLAKFHINEKGLVRGIRYLQSLTFEES